MSQHCEIELLDERELLDDREELELLLEDRDELLRLELFELLDRDELDLLLLLELFELLDERDEEEEEYPFAVPPTMFTENRSK